MSNKYVVKTTKEPKRGESGYLTVYYGYDTESKKSVTPTSPIKSDVERLLRGMNKSE